MMSLSLILLTADEYRRVNGLLINNLKDRIRFFQFLIWTRMLQDLASQWAERSPGSIAIEMDGQLFTYFELEKSSNDLAHVLLETRIQPGDRVGIYMPKSFKTVVLILGVLKAGGVYVPIDPLGPSGRALAIMRHCSVRYLIASPSLVRGLAESPGLPASIEHIILTGNRPDCELKVSGGIILWEEIQNISNECPKGPRRNADDLAYILYTSGSTGIPKGVMLSHRNALAFVEWACKEFQIQETDRLLNHAPFHFDLTVFDLYAAIRSGARTVLINEADARTPHKLVQLIVERGLTIWYSVPSVLVLMLERGGLEKAVLETLRLILFAGEVFPVKYLWRLMKAVPGAQYFNLYGPTETNVCTYYKVKPNDAHRIKHLPIGRACSGCQVYVLDEQGNEVQTGKIGELWVEGPTVMLGYWSTDGVPQSRPKRYCTGDFVSRNAEGDLIYHGRKDLMVKVRGFRVEIGEVEAALSCHPDIVEAAVIPLKDEFERFYLMATIVSNRGELSVLEVKQHCAKLLPDYMIPQTIWFLPSLPKTSTGKVDRVLLQSILMAKMAGRKLEGT